MDKSAARHLSPVTGDERRHPQLSFELGTKGALPRLMVQTLFNEFEAEAIF